MGETSPSTPGFEGKNIRAPNSDRLLPLELVCVGVVERDQERRRADAFGFEQRQVRRRSSAATGDRRTVHADVAFLDVRSIGTGEDACFGRDGDRRRKVRHLEQQRRRTGGNRRLNNSILAMLLRLVARENLSCREAPCGGDVDDRRTTR